jgi:hypothetical protein
MVTVPADINVLTPTSAKGEFEQLAASGKEEPFDWYNYLVGITQIQALIT